MYWKDFLKPKTNNNVDTTKTTTHIGLCAGYGGIELGLKLVIPNLRSVALCEIEAFACANLVAKMEAGLMDAAPIWSDLKTFPWSEFRGKVDILTGGYPCQPFSAAGKRLGTEDPRHLWPYIAGGIRILRPKLCFFENVEGHITLGLSTVISDLEEMGYRTTWGIFSASEVGAPHQRKRVFILAYDDRQRGTQYSLPFAIQTQLASAHSKGFGGNVWPSRPGEPQHDWEPPRVVGDTNGTGSQEWTGQRGAGIQGTHADGGETAERQTESSLGRDADGPADRMDDAIVFASDCRPCECCDDVICWRCQEHYADCPCPGPNSSDD